MTEILHRGGEPQHPGSLVQFAGRLGLATREAVFQYEMAMSVYRAELAASHGLPPTALYDLGSDRPLVMERGLYADGVDSLYHRQTTRLQDVLGQIAVH